MAEYKAPDIGTLSAHEFNKIRTSLDKYKATQTKPARGFDSRYERSRFDMTAREAKAAREPFKRGKGYGVEDEYRYMVSQGFRPESMQVAPQQQQAAAPVEEPKTGYTPTELDTGTDTAQQTQQTQQTQGPNFEELLATQIASMQEMFTKSMQQQQDQYMQMQAAQEERMAALQQQMQQAMIAQQQRPTVAGVKMAEGTGGTPMQIARRGVTGAFGRRGMRISSLNV